MDKLKALLISVCLILLAYPASGQSVGKNSLSHLDGIAVSVTVPEEVQKEGLYEDNLKSNTELQLRKADIDVHPEDEFTAHPAAPVLFISKGAFKDRRLFAYDVVTEVSQAVFTVDGTRARGTTYHVAGAVGTVGGNNIRDLTDVVRQQVRTFINDWLSVHE